jgi:hypothetical protein
MGSSGQTPGPLSPSDGAREKMGDLKRFENKGTDAPVLKAI